MELTKKETEALLKSQQGELDAVLMYQALAIAAKDPKDTEVFRTLAAEEGRHAAVFYALTNQKLKPKRRLASLLTFLYRVLGPERLYPLIAKGEYAAAKTYGQITEKFPEIGSVLADENRHGDTVLALLTDEGPDED